MLKIHNTMTRRKEAFVPAAANKVRMYVCGLTVYDHVHLGHARMLVAFDIIARYLRARGFELTYVRNITDIDDKILARAAANGEEFTALTARFITAMHEDEAALGIAPPDLEPRATAHMEQIIAMVKRLEAKGFAYKADNGDVYFSVSQFERYGRLSNKNLNQLLEGARVEVGELKHDPRDFALWKSAREEQDDAVGWDSPWGYGRPGWHIECSVMAIAALGASFDIHGGGSDLMFPHHENEIAQSECDTGQRFARYWLHNGPLRVDGDKMAKSAGNFLTVREALRRCHPEVLRQFLAASHYRSPVNYSDDSLQQAGATLDTLYHALKGLEWEASHDLVNSRFEKDFLAAMDDDFNTPKAFGILFDMAREINRLRRADVKQAARLGKLMQRLGGILGILQCAPEEFLRRGAAVDESEVERLVAERDAARKAKDWHTADALRAQLAAMNVVVEDGAGGGRWRVET